MRPETFFTYRALTSSTVKPRASRISNNGIQYTPVDSIATVSTPLALSQSANCSRSAVKLGNSRTGSSSRSGGTATKCEALPMSIPAALGWTKVSACRAFPDLKFMLRLRCAIAAPSFIVECGATSGTSSCSLSETGYLPTALNRRADSPMSMTSPRTTLMYGQICTIGRSVFRGTAFHFATACPPSVSSGRLAAAARLHRLCGALHKADEHSLAATF